MKNVVFSLISSAFLHEGGIPTRHTCEGKDLSPHLCWSHPPAGTQSFVLICDDPDAPKGTWVHWVVYNIPATTSELLEGVDPAIATLADGSMQGTNTWGKYGYGGPCPPSGTHRYFFKLYALDTKLPLKPGATKEEILAAMKGHVLGEAQLMGTYQLQKQRS